MNCMKCGREIDAEQVFCDTCLEDMARHPVRPGTVVLLPNHGKQPPKKAVPKKKAPPTVEEQLASAKRNIKFLRVTALILVLLAGILAYITSRVVTQLDIQRLLGSNYNTVQTVDPEDNR